MPRLNLRDEDPENQPDPMDDEGGDGPPPMPHEYHDGGGHKKTWLILVLIVVLAGGAIVALNQMRIIHLWGKKLPRVVESVSEPSVPLDTTLAGRSKELPASTSTPMPPDLSGKKGAGKKGSGQSQLAGKKVTAPQSMSAAAAKEPAFSQQSASPSHMATPPMGGEYAVQVSSWPSREAADHAASKVTEKGFSAYVVQADVKGQTWYRVRVGGYGSSDEAAKSAEDLQQKGYSGVFVVKEEK